MNDDFIKELGYKALDSRLKRISDRVSHDIRKLYKEFDIDVEPNWYLLFMLLQKTEKVSISYIAERLGYAHPSVVVIVKKMAKKVSRNGVSSLNGAQIRAQRPQISM